MDTSSVDRSYAVRVADPLGVQASRAAASDLQKALGKKQKTPAVKRAVLTAPVICDPTNSRLSGLLERAVRSRDAGDRVHALLAATRYELRQPAQALLRAGLAHKDAATRMAAAYALAHRDEGAMLTDLRDAAAAEKDAPVRAAMQTCVEVLAGAADRAAAATLRRQVVGGS